MSELTSHQTVITLTFVIYIILLLVLGVMAWLRTSSLSDYILGGRSLGVWVASISAGASDMSGWLLLGLPGLAFSSGMQAVWLVVGLWLGGYLNWRLIARRLRIYSEMAQDSLTLPEFLNQRFLDKTNTIRFISAFFTIVFFLIYTVSGLVASGKLFNTVFGIPYEYAILIGVTAIVIYTLIGGFLAVSWTDLFQGLLMLFALIVVAVLGIYQLQGIEKTIELIHNKRPEHLSLWFDKQGKELSFIAILSLLAWGLGYFGQPHILARFKAMNISSNSHYTRRIAITWSGLSMLAAVSIGMVGFAFLSGQDIPADPERIFMLMIDELLPSVLAGVCLAAILAAIMSTADSQLLVSASVLTEDVYRILNKKELSQQHLVWVGRVIVIALSVLALWLAHDPDSSVLDLVAYAWAGFGAAFGPVMILSLFWRNINRSGAIAGILSGAITVVVWKHLSGGIFELYEMVPGFLISLILIVVVSRTTRPPEEKVVDLYDKYTQRLSVDY
ncbi:MAG: sodium/proline symporter PutP [Thioalkalispiraceae bacterium]|jgi:sodium/proline symporter